ncbi:hypothetical protein M983_3239 [Proteus myxofaciens ATCC 19692]|uniref:HTH cro/C1-type domain-containing protein n=2 Tax=Proteus myxofaciens TaxID=184072 RepID=A0A198F042_9GAMM|nr:hypothetical protein M983_3239 [Proteus myxofaciens ATCC 19692]
MTGQQLAKLMNISQQQISRYEIGTTPITFDQLQEFLLVLDKRWLDVFKFLENETNPKIKRNENKYISWKSYPSKNL